MVIRTLESQIKSLGRQTGTQEPQSIDEIIAQLTSRLKITNALAASASVVALDPMTGKVAWKSPGDAAVFSSFLVAKFGGQRQLIGYEGSSISGWNPVNGHRLWKLVPPRPNDFNVPTPLVYGNRLVLATENNDTRMFDFNARGELNETPLATNEDLAPTHIRPSSLVNACLESGTSCNALISKADLSQSGPPTPPPFSTTRALLLPTIEFLSRESTAKCY